MIAAILLQPSKGDGGLALMSGGGSSQNATPISGLFKVTMYSAVFLLASSLFMSWSKTRNSQSSMLEGAAPIVSPQENSTGNITKEPVDQGQQAPKKDN